MHLSKPFYTGDLISGGVGEGLLEPSLLGYQMISFGESKVILEILTVQGVDIPNPGTVQGSNVYSKLFNYLIGIGLFH